MQLDMGSNTEHICLSQAMEAPEASVNVDSDGSGSSDEYSVSTPYTVSSAAPFNDAHNDQSATLMHSTSSPPLGSAASFAVNSYTSQWAGQRFRGGGSSGSSASLDNSMTLAEGGPLPDRDLRLQRPSGPARTPSNTYAPVRRPVNFVNLDVHGRRSSSAKRSARRDPSAQYRAQEKAYVQRLRANPQTWYEPLGGSQSMAYDSDVDDPSPSSEAPFEDDQYDPDIQLFLCENDNQPTIEELKNPKNQERLEWHSMLASVLKGDVVKQEKQRIIGNTEPRRSSVVNQEIWLGVRAKSCGRSLILQKKLIEDARASVSSVIEDIINFEIKGEKEIGKCPVEQVEGIVEKIQHCESLFPTRKKMEAFNSRTASDEFREGCDAVIAWHNTTLLINTELAILQNWVGNDELDFTKPRANRSVGGEISDDGTFLDRIMMEDGLKTLQGEHNIIYGIGEVINKAKNTLIENAEAFSKRHLPPYIEELLTLINFPSRLIQEIIRIRLSYARTTKDPAQQSPIFVDQMIAQFQILMRVAVDIKQRYLIISKPEPGWDLPPCIDENFDSVVVDAMKYYFRLLNWKLSANKNTFKEAEILEQEWGFSNEIGRQLEGGDIEVAEQFRYFIIVPLYLITMPTDYH